MSRFHSRFLEILAAAAAVAAATLAFASGAGAQESGYGVELTAGASYFSNSEHEKFDLSSLGVRFHRDFNDRWGFEISFVNQDHDATDADIYEASARFTFFENERVRVFALAGAGVLSYDYSYDVGGDAYVMGQDDTAIYHAGIAAEVGLGETFYFRPDFRERWAIDIFGPYEDTSSEATIAFGYRF